MMLPFSKVGENKFLQLPPVTSSYVVDLHGRTDILFLHMCHYSIFLTTRVHATSYPSIVLNSSLLFGRFTFFSTLLFLAFDAEYTSLYSNTALEKRYAKFVHNSF